MNLVELYKNLREMDADKFRMLLIDINMEIRVGPEDELKNVLIMLEAEGNLWRLKGPTAIRYEIYSNVYKNRYLTLMPMNEAISGLTAIADNKEEMKTRIKALYEGILNFHLEATEAISISAIANHKVFKDINEKERNLIIADYAFKVNNLYLFARAIQEGVRVVWDKEYYNLNDIEIYEKLSNNLRDAKGESSKIRERFRLIITTLITINEDVEDNEVWIEAYMKYYTGFININIDIDDIDKTLLSVKNLEDGLRKSPIVFTKGELLPRYKKAITFLNKILNTLKKAINNRIDAKNKLERDKEIKAERESERLRIEAERESERLRIEAERLRIKDYKAIVKENTDKNYTELLSLGGNIENKLLILAEEAIINKRESIFVDIYTTGKLKGIDLSDYPNLKTVVDALAVLNKINPSQLDRERRDRQYSINVYITIAILLIVVINIILYVIGEFNIYIFLIPLFIFVANFIFRSASSYYEYSSKLKDLEKLHRE